MSDVYSSGTAFYQYDPATAAVLFGVADAPSNASLTDLVIMVNDGLRGIAGSNRYTGDSAYDSTTLLDNFRWIADGTTVVVGTGPE